MGGKCAHTASSLTYANSTVKWENNKLLFNCVPSVEHTWEHTPTKYIHVGKVPSVEMNHYITAMKQLLMHYAFEKKKQKQNTNPELQKGAAATALLCAHLAFLPTKAKRPRWFIERMWARSSWYSTGNFSGPATVKRKRILLLLTAYLFDLWPCNTARVIWRHPTCNVIFGDFLFYFRSQRSFA